MENDPPQTPPLPWVMENSITFFDFFNDTFPNDIIIKLS